MSLYKRFLSLSASVLLAILCVVPAFAAGEPEVYVKADNAAVGDKIAVTLAMKNVLDFTSADYVISYNPYMLRLVSVEQSKAMTSDKEIQMMYTDVEDAGAVDSKGLPVHEFALTMFHINKFGQNLENCDIVTLEFEALGGGECPIVLSMRSFYIDDKEVKPTVNSCVINIDGQPAENTWNYAEHPVEDVEYTDASYTFTDKKPISAEQPVTDSNTVRATENNASPEKVNEKSGVSAGVIITVIVVLVTAAAVVVIVVNSAKKKTLESEN